MKETLFYARMSQRTTIAVFLFVLVCATLIFSKKPPRAQAHLAEVEKVVTAVLADIPLNHRIYFTADSASEDAYVWSRYFAAPHRLLPGGRGTGDTVLWLHNMTGIDIPTSPGGTEIFAHRSGNIKAALIVLF